MKNMAKDPMNVYTMARANDPGTELVQLVIDFYRNHRGTFTSTEATNIGTEVTNILNGTHKV